MTATKHDDVLPLVSAGLVAPKKRDHSYARQASYLNYGLLALASALRSSGYPARVYHGQFSDSALFAEWLLSKHRRAPALLLSLPSFHSIEWAAGFCAAVKHRLPDIHIIAGGRWVVDGNQEWVHTKLPHVDRVEEGVADRVIASLVADALGSPTPSVASSDAPPLLDYSLLHDHLEYTPSVEHSRGCGYGCEFCRESRYRGEAVLVSPERVMNQMLSLTASYGERTNVYMEASIFKPPQQWVDRFCQLYSDHGCRLRWRCETRVDSLAPEVAEQLSVRGFAMVDLGLESASPRQLLAMRKTPNPAAYLRQASELMAALSDNGIMPKINLLLYPGEDEKSLDETCAWLDKHRPHIKGISAYPLIVYGPGQRTKEFLDDLRTRFGTEPVGETLSQNGFTHLHLTRSLDHDASIAHAERISREFMTADDYWDLKHFCYFRRSYSRGQFFADIASISEDELPFKRGTG